MILTALNYSLLLQLYKLHLLNAFAILIFETDTYGSINSKNSGMQAGLGGILYSQLPHADWYIPRARASMAEVAKAELVNRWFYTTQSQLQDIFRNDWTFAGKYFKAKESVQSRIWKAL